MSDNDDDPRTPLRRWLDRAQAGQLPRTDTEEGRLARWHADRDLFAAVPRDPVERAARLAKARAAGLLPPEAPARVDVHAWIASGTCPWASPSEWAQLTPAEREDVEGVIRELITLEPDLAKHVALAVEAGRGAIPTPKR